MLLKLLDYFSTSSSGFLWHNVTFSLLQYPKLQKKSVIADYCLPLLLLPFSIFLWVTITSANKKNGTTQLLYQKKKGNCNLRFIFLSCSSVYLFIYFFSVKFSKNKNQKVARKKSKIEHMYEKFVIFFFFWKTEPQLLKSSGQRRNK